jgi:hypothetical protein
MASSGATAAPSVRALSCPACGGALELRAAGYSVTVACIYCGSILDVANPDVRLITRYQEAAQELEIPLGTRGTLRGVEWEVIGYLRRSEHGSYGWEEYLLFNPYHGYRWLVNNRGGWSFGEMLTRTPDWMGIYPQLDGETYQPFFTNGQAQVDYVLGEFYWRVQVGEEVATDDYVRPGWMLSREANAAEVAWTLSELIDPKVMAGAFGVEALLSPWPPLPHQPSPWGRPLKIGVRIAGAAAVILILMSLIFDRGVNLLQATVPFTMTGQEQSTTLGPITLTRPYQAVSIRAEGPMDLDNAWVDLDYSLVNRATQESFDAYGLVEHYTGRDVDGYWQEGTRLAETRIAAVPAGTYDLVVETRGNHWSSSSQYDPYSREGAQSGGVIIQVSGGSLFGSNLALALLLLFLPIGYFLFRHINFERARNAESDTGSDEAEDEEEEEDEHTGFRSALDDS